jgi:hypothetical protein
MPFVIKRFWPILTLLPTARYKVRSTKQFGGITCLDPDQSILLELLNE